MSPPNTSWQRWKSFHPCRYQAQEQMFSLLIKINEFGVKCEHLNAWDISMRVHVRVYAKCHAVFSYVSGGSWSGDNIVFLMICTKSFVLSSGYINFKVFLKTCLMLLSQCAIYVINAIMMLFPAGVPLLYPELLLKLPLWWRASACSDEVMSITEQTNRTICLKQAKTHRSRHGHTQTHTPICSSVCPYTAPHV